TVRDLRRWLNKREGFAKCDRVFVTAEGGPCRDLTFSHAFMHHRNRIGVGNGGPGRNITPHTIRHYFSTDWLRQGGDIAKLKAMTGHKSYESLKVYEHLAGDVSVAREQDRVSPRKKISKTQRVIKKRTEV